MIHLELSHHAAEGSQKSSLRPTNSIRQFSRLLVFVFCISCASMGTSLGQTLRIYHIDVDQGDATLFVSPGGKSLLVDGGKNGHGGRIKKVMEQAGIDTIQYFVCTHYHEDHYGGIDDLVLRDSVTVVQAYDRGDKTFLPSSTLNGDTYKGYQQAVGEGATHLMRGETISLDPSVSVTCISSGGVVLGEINPIHGADENDMSVSLLVQYNGFQYFIGGDIEGPTEQKIADRDLVLDVDIYQANHHGSNTSSTSGFLHDLIPSVIVISNGNHGTYKHPRQSTLDSFAVLDPKPTVFQTNKYLKGGVGGNTDDDFIADLESSDEDGTILITVDQSGSSYTITYRNQSNIFATKKPIVPVAAIVIESLLPNPAGDDRALEEVTLRNKGTIDVSVAGWHLRDKGGRVWALVSMGVIQSGHSASIKRNGMPMNLNNNGDRVTLLDPNNRVQDQFVYTTSQESVWIETGH